MSIPHEKSSRWLQRILIALVLINAFCAGLHTVADADMGWHLATGRWVVQHHQVPRTDVLSFPSAGTPWTYPVLGEVIFYLIYSAFGYAGLSWFCALVCLAVISYLLRGGDLPSICLAMLAIGSVATRTGARPDLFSTVFFALVLGELWAFHRGARARLWLLPLIMLLWVNCHPGFIAGFAAMAAYLLAEASDLAFAGDSAAVRLRLRKILPWLAGAVAATAVNPWGPKIYATALSFLGPQGSSQGRLNGNLAISEFRPVPISSHMLYQLVDVRHPEFGFTWLLALAIVAAVLLFWKRQFGAGLVILGALYAALSHVRYSALFAITVAILGAEAFGALFADRGEARHPSRAGVGKKPMPATALRPLASAAMVLMIFVGAVSLVQIKDLVSNRTYVIFNPDLRFGAGAASWLPRRAADFILREQLPGNIFEDYELGGFAAWSLGPKYPDFIDGRGNNPDLGMEQFNLYNQDPDSQAWQSAAERWKLNVIWMATADLRGMKNLDVDKFCHSAGWRPVYMDEVSLVFLRNVPENSAWIDRLQLDCLQKSLDPPAGAAPSGLEEFYTNAAELFFLLHRDSEVEEALRRAQGLLPEDPNVRLLRGLWFERQQQNAAAEQEFLVSLAINENSGVWYSLSRVYGSEGRNEDALRALQRAAGLSLQPFNIYMTMAKLQIALDRPQQALESFAQAERTSPYRDGAEALAPEVYAELAEGRSEAYRRQADWAQAISFQQEAVRWTPSSARRWDRLARLYEATGQTKDAAEARQRLAQLQDGMNQGLSKNP